MHIVLYTVSYRSFVTLTHFLVLNNIETKCDSMPF